MHNLPRGASIIVFLQGSFFAKVRWTPGRNSSPVIRRPQTPVIAHSRFSFSGERRLSFNFNRASTASLAAMSLQLRMRSQDGGGLRNTRYQDRVPLPYWIENRRATSTLIHNLVNSTNAAIEPPFSRERAVSCRIDRLLVMCSSEVAV